MSGRACGIASPRKDEERDVLGADNMASKSPSETDSIGADSDSSVTPYPGVLGSAPSSGQRVFRWSKFVRNLYEMAIDTKNFHAVGFSQDGLCLEVRDSKLLSSEVLHRYFKHSNVSSFIRQLNNYGFKTVPILLNSSISHCFVHDYFQRDRLDLLEGVTRRLNGSEAGKITETISTLKGKELEFEQRMNQLKRVNEQLRHQNFELQEENKRLRTNWMSVQETLRSRMYEPQHQNQHRRMQYQQSGALDSAMYSGLVDPGQTELFMMPNVPTLFPDEL